MKQNFLKITLFVFALFVALVGCKKDEPNPDPITFEDGIYIVGSVTPFDSIKVAGLFDPAINEVDQKLRTGLYELYVPIKAGATGFQIAIVEGGVPKYYGPGSDFAVVTNPTTDEPKVDFQRGSLVETTTVFTVPADGMYHVGFDKELMKAVVVPVNWGIIGGATPGKWEKDTLLVQSAFDMNAMSWELTNLVLVKGDFKFRHSHGWKVELDTVLVVDAANSKIGIKLNTNFGGSPSALVAGGDNITNTVPGFYTVNLAWTLAGGYVATLTKTGNLETIDYSTTELGMIGTGFNFEGVPNDWVVTRWLHVPIVDGYNFTWTWNDVEVLAAGSFKFRSGQDWAGKIIGFNEVVMAGSGAADFSANGDGNFVPAADGTYDFTLLIDAVTETYTFTAEPVVK